MSRLSKSITVLILVMGLGWHWAVLQSFAWASMLVRYSQQSDFLTAVVQTFDGLNPCSICEFVDEGRSAEKEQQQKQGLSLKKFELAVQEAMVFRFQPPGERRLCTAVELPCVRTKEPPSPPPRFV